MADKSAQEILAASQAAATSASSVHVISRGRRRPGGLSLNAELAGQDARGRVSVAGIVFNAIRIGDTVYVKGNPVFYEQLYEQLKSTAHVPPGTWLKGSASSGELASLAAFTYPVTELGLLLRNTGRLTKGATTRIDGQDVIELKQTAKLFNGSIYIATSGKPYPVQIVKRGRQNGQTSFLAWNQPVSVAAPSPSVDVSTLKG